MEARADRGDPGRSELSPLGRTIVLRHGAPAAKTIVLLHGLTATPAQFAEFGNLLHRRGANVLIPRLPRHGYADRMTKALERLTETELTEFAQHALAEARDLGGEVTFAGFSLGALLSLWLAQHESLHRVVAIAPFLGLVWLPDRFAHGVARTALQLPNRFLWWHPLERERFREPHGYPRYPSHAVARAYHLAHRLLEAAERSAPATRDITLVTNACESTVSNRAVRRLARRWRVHGITIAEHLLRGLPRSHDIIALEPDPSLANRAYPQLLDLVAPKDGCGV